MAIRAFRPADLDALVRAAQSAPRRRMNLNVHRSAADACQRFFNAIEPGSYVRPHRHAQPAVAETLVAIRGAFVLVEFDDAGGIVGTARLAASGSAPHPDAAAAVELAPGTWHTVLALESGSIFFEAKPGPFDPQARGDFAPWAPEEGAAEAAAWWQALRARVIS
jgi:cupin fold WbuC family metalloprotein